MKPIPEYRDIKGALATAFQALEYIKKTPGYVDSNGNYVIPAPPIELYGMDDWDLLKDLDDIAAAVELRILDKRMTEALKRIDE